MNNKKDEQLIYVKDLLFTALYQWKKILIVAVVLALALGAYSGVSGWLSLMDPDAMEAAAVQNAIAMERYEAQKNSLELQIEVLRENVQKQQTYLDNSVLMQLDPYGYYEAVLNFHIQTDYQILPELSYQNPDRTDAIISAYNTILLGNSTLRIIADEMDTEPQYLIELLEINSDASTDMLSVRAMYPSAEGAEKLLSLLMQQIETIGSTVTQTVEDHSVSVLEQTVKESIDLALVNIQKAETDRLINMVDALSNTQTSLLNLVLPVAQATTMTEIAKDAIILAVAGGILGAFLVVFVAWIAHITSSKVYSARTLRNRTGLKVLGCVSTEQVKNPVDLWLRKLEGRNICNTQAQAELSAVSIRNRCDGVEHLLVTGGTDAGQREPLVQALRRVMPGVQVDHCDSVLHCVEALDALTTHDTVVLVEKCNTSTYTDVAQQIEIICDSGKQILGCVLLDG